MFKNIGSLWKAAGRQAGPDHVGRSSRKKIFLVGLGLGVIALLLTTAVTIEARMSFVQSFAFSRWARALTYQVRSGESSDILFPRGGPDDKRRGYSDLPAYLAALRDHKFSIARQASWSPELESFAERRGYPVYHEKKNAGLTLLDRAGRPFYRAREPERTYESFQTIPPLIVKTLQFIEDRSLLDDSAPQRNPAVNWNRLFLATMGHFGGWFDSSLKQGGGSTLATQIEKFRHYPGGLTRTIHDKLGQMLSATMRSYLDGPATAGAQQRIVSTYLNSTPLGARAGYGEIIGLADGMWAWFGRDINDANSVLTGGGEPGRKAEIFKQVLSLLLAQRRPSYYLSQERMALEALTNTYLRLLADAKIIDVDLRDLALSVSLAFLPQAPAAAPRSFIERKAATSVQVALLTLLKKSSLYDLDRLDLTASTTFDAPVQSRIGDLLARLGDKEQLQSFGLIGPKLLESEDPSAVAYSVVLYERVANQNVLRIRADSVDQPFDLNSGSKLILGSTAKLRTLITYLGLIGRLHDTYEGMASRQLWEASEKATDPLTRWAASYLAQAIDRRLQPMLDAAIQRRYSADPGAAFFTGGGIHVFHNYEQSEDGQRPTVEDAFVNSINLVFVRMMRDIRDYYIAQEEAKQAQYDDAPADIRERYLSRFANQEGSTYLSGFYKDFHGRSQDEVLSLLAERATRSPKHLGILFRSVAPFAPVKALRDFLERELPRAPLDEEEIDALYLASSTDRYSLSDRGYLVGLHPLRLWLAEYLGEHPDATLSEVLTESEMERQESYQWLFKTRHAGAQNGRIQIIREQDAFKQIALDWRAQGYPFAHLVPSLATALGSSGDRPDALADLMGIILNDGVQLPTVSIHGLSFAAGTPYETELAVSAHEPNRVFAPEIARTVRRALTSVVARGTGSRLHGAFVTADGIPLAVGGKTGTGDNRFKTFGPGHELIESRVVDRTATFVFFIGERLYGTVTVYVGGPQAANYHFSSALAVQLLKALAPELQPLVETESQPNRNSEASRVSSVSDPS